MTLKTGVWTIGISIGLTIAFVIYMKVANPVSAPYKTAEISQSMQSRARKASDSAIAGPGSAALGHHFGKQFTASGQHRGLSNYLRARFPQGKVVSTAFTYDPDRQELVVMSRFEKVPGASVVIVTGIVSAASSGENITVMPFN